MDKRVGRRAGCDYGCRVLSRLAPAALVLALVTGVATGCFAQPDPEPESTPLFASEDEAFAAAEETYRQYVDALNQVDLSDPETFEDVYAWTTGEANAGAREIVSARCMRTAWIGELSVRRVIRSMESDLVGLVQR